jgi:hypothetical protein
MWLVAPESQSQSALGETAHRGDVATPAASETFAMLAFGTEGVSVALLVDAAPFERALDLLVRLSLFPGVLWSATSLSIALVCGQSFAMWPG